MKTTVLLGAAAMLALTAAGPAAAQDRRGGMGMEMMFERLDTNADGHITRDEAVVFARAEAADRAERRAGARFDRADADGDGRLTAAELMAGGGGMRGGMDIGRMFDRLDSDGDSAISREEAEAARREFRRGHDRMGERREAMGHRHGPGHGGN